jgi:hypothetical protein
MKLSDPVWYEALQGNPVAGLSFNEELKTRIKAQALSSTVHKKWRPRRLSAVGVALIGILACMLFVTNPSDIRNGFSEQGQQVRTLPENKWQTAIDIKYPDYRNEILYKQSVGDEKMLIFSKKILELNGYQSISLGVDGFSWESEEWKWQQSVSYSIKDPQSGGFKKALVARLFELDRTPTFLGVVSDPQISKVQVVDIENKKQEAEIVPNEDGNRYWYISAPKHKYGYRVEGLDAEGKVIITLNEYDFY